MTETVPETDNLIARLRGEYRIPITDGLGPAGGDEPDNPAEFVRHFQTPPIQHEAATALEAAQSEAAFYRAAGIAEIAAVNPRVMEYMTHWEGRVEAAQARIVELQDRVLLAYNLAKKAEDFRKTARREALEEAANLMDDIAYEIGARPMSSIHSALCEYRKRIRALMEKPNDQP